MRARKILLIDGRPDPADTHLTHALTAAYANAGMPARPRLTTRQALPCKVLA